MDESAICSLLHHAIRDQLIDEQVEEPGVEEFRRVDAIDATHFLRNLAAVVLQGFPGAWRL